MADENVVVSIGEAAEASGASTPTIRYYEEIGLIPPARRNAAGHRHYSPADIERLIFIRRCRDLGFGIEKVRLLCGLAASPDEDCARVRDVAADHLSSVRYKLEELRCLEKQLAAFVDACDFGCRGGASCDCVVLTELAQA